MDKERRQESSIPVQGRVSIITMAKLAMYWKGNGYEIRTVSQLIGWSMDLLHDIIKSNGMIGKDMNVEEARSYLLNERLFQKSSMDKGFKKLTSAIRFEDIRSRGGDPGKYKPTKRDYNMLHRAPNPISGEPSSVVPFEDIVNAPNLDEAVRIANTISDDLIRDRLEERDRIVIKSKMTSAELDAKAKELEDHARAEQLAMDEFLASMNEKKEDE